MIAVFMYEYHYKPPSCVIYSLFMVTNRPWAAAITHLIIQLFVQLSDLLLVLLPLLV